MWYAASLLFRGIHSIPTDQDDLWEESIRLIQASDENEAESKATLLGQASEVSYLAQGRDKVSWKFVQIERIFQIDDDPLTSGSEVFSRFLKSSEVASLLTSFKDE
jgi:uncharacterized protein DUF4288